MLTDIGLKFAHIGHIYELVGKVSKVVKSLFVKTNYSLTSVKLLSFSFDLVLRSDHIFHVSYLSIDCELIDVYFVFRVANVQFSHIFDNFPQEVARICFIVFVKDILEHDFCLLIEPHFKNNEFVIVEESDEVVLDDGYDFLDVW